MADQLEVRAPEDLLLAQAALVERNLLCLPSDSADAGAVLSFQTSLDGGKLAERRRDRSKDPRGETVVGEQADGADRAERGGQLRGEDDEVKHLQR